MASKTATNGPEIYGLGHVASARRAGYTEKGETVEGEKLRVLQDYVDKDAALVIEEKFEDRPNYYRFTVYKRPDGTRPRRAESLGAKPRRAESLGAKLRRRGFDLTTYDRSTGYYRPACSCCQAMVINGTACHETGCSNAR